MLDKNLAMKTGLLLSGGMDSVAIAYWKRPAIAITINYGQKPAEGEIRAASAVASALNIHHEIISLDCSALGSGDLAGVSPIPSAPMTEWWPFRNQFLVTIAAMKLISMNVEELYIGTVKSDSFHADGRSDFIDCINKLLLLQEGHLSLIAPAIDMTSDELIVKSEIPKDILSYSHSCHTLSYACGKCRGCTKHYETMSALGYDPY